MKSKPKFIFKYRALTGEKEKERLFDIIHNNRLYLPTVYQLNDPFEGKTKISAGMAGDFIRRAIDVDYYPVRVVKNSTRVLALSESCFSPQLWAYYCNDYRGVCLCYKTDQTFSDIKPVEYAEAIGNEESIIVNSYPQVIDIVNKNLFVKQKGWEYEHEWRIVSQADEAHLVFEEPAEKAYFEYDQDELVGVILGNKLDDDIAASIAAQLPEHTKLFVAVPGMQTGRVNLTEYGYRYRGDGSQPDFIKTLDELADRLR